MPKDLGGGYALEDADKDFGGGFVLEGGAKDLGGGFSLEGSTQGPTVPGSEKTGVPQVPMFNAAGALQAKDEEENRRLRRWGLEPPPGAVEAVTDIAAGSGERRAHGIHELAGTVGKGVAPLAIPAAIAAPVATGVGVLSGIAGSHIGSKLYELASEAPDVLRGMANSPAPLMGGLGLISGILPKGEGYKEIAGDVGGLAGGIAGYKAAPAIKAGISALGRRGVAAAGVSPKVDPAVALARGLNPPAAMGPKWREDVSIAGPHIKQAAGGKVETLDDLLRGRDAVVETGKAALEKNYIAPARERGQRFNGDDIVKATEDAVNAVQKLEDPQSAQDWVAEAQRAYGGKTFDADQMHELLIGKNAELHPLYAKKQGQIVTAELASKPQAITKAQRDAIARIFYEGLDPERTAVAGKMTVDPVTGKQVQAMEAGQGPRKIQDVIHRALSMGEAAEGQASNVLKEQPLSDLEVRKRQAQAIANLPGKLWHGRLGERGVAAGNIGESIPEFRSARSGRINMLIKDAFAEFGQPEAFPGAGPSGPAIPPQIAEARRVADLRAAQGPKTQHIPPAQPSPNLPQTPGPIDKTPSPISRLGAVRQMQNRLRPGSAPPPIQGEPAPPAAPAMGEAPGGAESLHNLYQLMRSPQFKRMPPNYKNDIRNQAALLAQQLDPAVVRAIQAPFIYKAPTRLNQPIKINRIDEGF